MSNQLQTIQLTTPVQKTISAVTLIDFTDNSNTKTVTARTLEFGQVKVWEGDAYTAAGDYTQAQFNAQLVAAIAALPTK